ncbi:MAG TPA: hypothetical protein VM238_20675, partial [Phycisphaerae bacterium]|nr:hypothetical protein [Phycisphaerae bacterium]
RATVGPESLRRHAEPFSLPQAYSTVRSTAATFSIGGQPRNYYEPIPLRARQKDHFPAVDLAGTPKDKRRRPHRGLRRLSNRTASGSYITL